MAQTRMTAALAAMEQAMEALASAHAEYANGLHTEARAAIQRRGRAGGFPIVHGIGVDRLNDVLVMRLRALGLDGVLASARRSGELSEAWVDEWVARVQDFVNEQGGVR